MREASDRVQGDNSGGVRERLDLIYNLKNESSEFVSRMDVRSEKERNQGESRVGFFFF